MKSDLSRVTLRPFKPTDVDDFLRGAGDDRVTKFLRWEPFSSREDALTFIKKECIPHPYRRSICFDDRSIGFVWFYPGSDDIDRHKANLSYGIATDNWGQGLSTKTLKIAIPQIFKELPDLVRLEAYVKVGNEASGRVLEKVGFQREGLLRKFVFFKVEIADVYSFSFLSTDLLKPT